MSKIDIRRLDFNLLVIFLELMRHRKATLVADRLGLTQSTISHALGRLRDVIEDELFLRRPNGLEPTARALELEPSVRRLVEMAEGLINPDRAFQPATASGLIRIGAADCDCAVLAPPLIRHLRNIAPGLVVSLRPVLRQHAIDGLSSGELELAMGVFHNVSPGIDFEPLFQETFAVIARPDHPALVRGTISLDTYAAAEHVLVSFEGDSRGVVDRTLEELGMSRNVVATVPFFFPALSVVRSSSLIATVPRRLAEIYAPMFGLACIEPPLAVRPFQVSLAWHARWQNSSIREWIIGEIRQSLEQDHLRAESFTEALLAS
ncbi:LysR family transcriptional regulator [Inquilinus sp. OTU3971]|uniref:LysR family transcriptional regulator n=1 Tax=Inquilinus sp. OTU3971 TaxID=3043855 RepID=UPI00313C5BF4